jgi:hypothetical protein
MMSGGKFMPQTRAILSLIGTWPRKLWQTYWAIGSRPRFPNVPDKLTVFVRDHMALFGQTGNRDFLYLEAAGSVIAQYLNVNVFSGDNRDSFWGARRVNEEGDLWYRYPLRVILIGETLFLLRNTSGFAEMCRRLRTRALRPPFYEMLAAKIFSRAGFDIGMRPDQAI